MPERPTHHLIVQDKENKSRKTRAGVAWVNADGWFNISLNPGVVLTDEVCEHCYLNLYPTKEYEDRVKASYPLPDEDKHEVPPFTEKDIPF